MDRRPGRRGGCMGCLVVHVGDAEEDLLQRCIHDGPVGDVQFLLVALHRREHVPQAEGASWELVVAGAGQGVEELRLGYEAHHELMGGHLVLDTGGDGELEARAETPLQVCGVADASELAASEDAEAVAQGICLLHGVGGEEHGAVLLVVVDHVPQRTARCRVQPGGGLVEQHDLGVAHEGDGDAEATLHAAGVLAGLLVAGLEQVDLGEAVRHHVLEQRPVHVLESAVEHQVLPAGEVVPKEVVLRAHPEQHVDLVDVFVDVVLEDGGCSAARHEEAAEHVDCGGFAGAVGP
mmetsp:Transcript_104/g.235  ORF Transcript_104/g.235 Transcript_104/m.235 type:complete len:293 (+) Transcript_104:161-1039(+)